MQGVYESNEFLQERHSANSSLKLTNSTIGKAGEQILGTGNTPFHQNKKGNLVDPAFKNTNPDLR